jgi:hypothetical protein
MWDSKVMAYQNMADAIFTVINKSTILVIWDLHTSE